MEYLTFAFFAILLAAVVMEAVDSSLGMMYGTVLAPLLIAVGFSPLDVVPALLISQAVGGIAASFRHYQFRNASFNPQSEDFKVAVMIFVLGIVAVMIGAFVGLKVSKFALSLYIAILMLVMGLIVLVGVRFKFSWNRILIIGFISSFNKALSGGGFGPVVTSGQMIVGRNGKNSVGSTTMSEVEICTASFVVWILLNRQCPSIPLMTALCVGALIGGGIGPYLLSRIKDGQLLTKCVGLLAVISGTLALIKILT
ncbi:MAG: hypothetical protein A2Y71_06175 [Bacteroidetes bacterium RBG_13_42_15]|nr:MAG: hypothetical protein A2Y71_06175 [Bacteroidetes bacterium RBG_13_42_15]